MNIFNPDLKRDISREDAEEAFLLLKEWASDAEDSEIQKLDPTITRLLSGEPEYPELERSYPGDFSVDAAYKATLPDLQNGPESLIKGARQVIQHVGISNFRLPVRFLSRDGGVRELTTSVTGSVSLDADKKGINMSRIMRRFYDHAESVFSFDVIETALDDYKTALESFDARIQMAFSYPLMMDSLRSGLSGWQYYDIALEVVEQAGVRQRILHLDYVYSSTSPCSLELSEHARRERGQMATPHSQRSVARLSMVIKPEHEVLWFEDIIDLCRAAVPTETQVMVKREDEQAFAELNAANPIFVEDAVRLFAEALKGEERVGDFRVAASHQESLHSHDAVSVLTDGQTFAGVSLDPRFFETLIHKG